MTNEKYTLGTFRRNWKEHGFLEALRTDNKVTESRYEAPTLEDIHNMGKAMAYVQILGGEKDGEEIELSMEKGIAFTGMWKLEATN